MLVSCEDPRRRRRGRRHGDCGRCATAVLLRADDARRPRSRARRARRRAPRRAGSIRGRPPRRLRCGRDRALARELRADVVLNATDPRFNPQLFGAAFEARWTYLDMAMTL